MLYFGREVFTKALLLFCFGRKLLYSTVPNIETSKLASFLAGQQVLMLVFEVLP